jgi:EpsI family protein
MVAGQGSGMLIRALVATGLIVAAGVYASGASGPERVVARTPLAATPMTLGSWHGREASPLADDVVAQLGVDDYINRQYSVDGTSPVAAYVGYYSSQRQGDTIHSPQNCLPGAGWQPVFSDRPRIGNGSESFPVNRFVIQKGLERQAVFYWYQGRGRIVADEFANKGWLMLDAARLRRSDGGVVRLMTPITRTPESAFAALETFSTALMPHLSKSLP